MSSRAIPKSEDRALPPLPEICAPGNPPINHVADLVRELCRIAPERADSPEGCDTVMLDVEIDGYRCLLVKLRHADAQALSPRELEIARLVARGYPNKVIAGVLEISCWTVGTHLRRIFAKLNINSRAAMVARLQSDNWL